MDDSNITARAVDAYASERRAFYEALLAACDNKWLLWAWRLLYAQNTRYRRMYPALAKYELELNPGHERILKAVLARDADQAVALSAANYEAVSRFIEEHVDHGRPAGRGGHTPLFIARR